MLITCVGMQLKPLKIAVFVPNMDKKRVSIGQKLKPFYFIIITCFERVINVFLFFPSEISCVSKIKYFNAVMAYAAMCFYICFEFFP